MSRGREADQPIGPVYAQEHWLRQDDPDKVLAAFAQQQGKGYSRIKNRFIAELLGDLSGASFLDFGCGPGGFLLHAARAGARRVVGVDSQVTALAAAARLLRGQAPDCERLLVAARDMTCLEGASRFDVILLKDIIEHMPDDLALLQQTARLMRPGSRLVISTQNARSLNYAMEGFVQRRLLGKRDWRGWDPTHLRFYTPDSLSALLGRAGLEPLAWRSSYLVPHKLPRGRGRFLRLEFLIGLDRMLGGRRPFDRLGWCLMVRAGLAEPGRRRS